MAEFINLVSPQLSPQQLTPPVPVIPDNMITEDGLDNIITEDGDQIVTET